MQLWRWQELDGEKQAELLTRPASQQLHIKQKAQAIIDEVKQDGDQELFRLTQRIDQVALTSLEISDKLIEQAWQTVPSATLQALRQAYRRIYEQQRQYQVANQTIDTQDGVVCQRVARPIENVGLYVPGGEAPLVSTVLMNAIPAQLAGCPGITLCTPPDSNGGLQPALIVAASMCGVSNIYTLGGAQAIAAMAYGTATIPKCYRLFGPGNSWVEWAKHLVAQDPRGARIDLPAGPSEVLIIADGKANASWVAADLLAQAEHGPDSQVILITPDQSLAEQVLQNVYSQAQDMPRSQTIYQALASSRILVVDDLYEAVDLSNRYAPEHLMLQVEKPDQYIPEVKNAGTVFVGAWTPETLGDYITGSNHVLPTGGAAKAYSGLSVSDFQRFMTIQYSSPEGINHLGEAACQLAMTEGLYAHKKAVEKRQQAIETEVELSE